MNFLIKTDLVVLIQFREWNKTNNALINLIIIMLIYDYNDLIQSVDKTKSLAEVVVVRNVL